MKKQISLFSIAFFFGLLLSSVAHAQPTAFGYSVLVPANPTSFDNIKLLMASRTCGGSLPYKGNSYNVSMAQNKITITVGEQLTCCVPTCPPNFPYDEIDIGRLPAGNYTITTVLGPSNFSGGPAITNAPFTVTDARLLKTAPYVRLDYSGHWWDPNDSGWGLFIWHDALDNVLAAWFTYGTDGKPIWYVFQPTWQTFAATTTTPMRQTSRPPGTTIPPPNPTTYTAVGTASLDFTNLGTADEGKFTYTFTGGPTTVRNIQRFKP